MIVMRSLWFAGAATCALYSLVDRGTAADPPGDRPWRTIPLVVAGQIDAAWRHTGHGGFVVEGDAVRTECAPEGLGLLVYTAKRLGNCQIRLEYKTENATSNSGLYVRIDEGIVERLGTAPAAFERDQSGQPTANSLQRVMASADGDAGPWYAVHHGYEVQICDAADEWHRTGAIYSLAPAEAAPPATPGDWRTLTVTLREQLVEVEVDNRHLTKFDAAAPVRRQRRNWFEPKREPTRPTSGYIGLQNHDPGDVVYFRNLAVRPLD